MQLARQSAKVLCPGCGGSFRLRDAPGADAANVTTRLGKFQLLERLGLGGFGAVWRARDTELDRVVALKIPHAGLLAEPKELERFQREARASAQLRHPHIVTVYDVETLNGLPVIVAEYVSGGALKDLLAARRLTFRQSAALIALLADALEYAHAMGVVHRDVKPANIMLMRQDGPVADLGDVGKPMIVDFGLALRDAIETTMTMDGHILGTPAYMSPEQAAGQSHQADRRSDVYSLGVVLYELLTGEVPFRGSRAMLFHQVIHEEPRPPRAIDDKIPRDLETICLKCLAKAPAQRYATARELAEDLRRFLAGEPIQARPVGTMERFWRWCQRKPALALASGAAAAGVLLALLTFAVALIAVSVSLYLEHQQRQKAEKLATDNDFLAKSETAAKLDAERRREESERRREQLEQSFLQMRFDGAFVRFKVEPDAAMVAVASLLPDAMKLTDPALQHSMRLHLGAWREEIHLLRGIAAHDAPITSVALSADGKLVLTGDENATARLWDTDAGKALGPPLAHRRVSAAGPNRVMESGILAVALSEDGKLALTGGTDKTARLWNPTTGAPIGPPLSHQHSVFAVALSEDKQFAVTASRDGTARIWDANTGKPIGPPLKHQGAVTCVAISSTATQVLTGSTDKTARFWHLPTGKPLGPPLLHQTEVVAVVLSPDGQRALTGSPAEIKLWDVNTYQPIGAALNQGRPGAEHRHVLGFTSDGRLALAGMDRTARLWWAANPQPASKGLDHQDSITFAAVNSDGTRVLTGGNWKVRVWGANDKPIGQPLRHRMDYYIRGGALSRDGRTAITYGLDRTVRVWRTATAKTLGPLLSHNSVRAAAISADGKVALLGGYGRDARLWDTTTGKQLAPPLAHDGVVEAVALSADGKIALTGSRDGAARLWRTDTGALVGAPLPHKSPVQNVALSADGKIALAGCQDGTAQLWDTASGKLIGPTLGQVVPWPWKTYVALSADGAIALVANNRGTALWRTATRTQIDGPLNRQGSVSIALSADGTIALTANMAAQVWDAKTGNPIGPPLPHQSSVLAMALSADGKIALTASQDKTDRIWDTATGKPIGAVLPHQSEVAFAALSADGKIALTGAKDGTANLWDTATGKPLGEPIHSAGHILHHAFCPDGKTAITTNYSNGMHQLWRVPQPVSGDPQRVALWAQVVTGLELDDNGNPRVLDADAWQRRRQRLQELGGPPVQ